ncbi:hypothetical protein [Oleiagrimonas sp. C23AA]|uniref:hypothetical protein n=1 Tax=Oleiagrimonas sp. C23AA TaxID=2719047 RepID=UPI001423D485|nr:hypothetical protein [Oleiagrimonas sp. C23AA]NII10586.1 hypothetical protein [Oleiagrimonas sp. C23AA]
MSDILVRHIDDPMAERIKTLARERGWSINDVVLHALRHGLGLADGEGFGEHSRELQDIAHLGGTWDADEAAAFQSALEAMASTPDGFGARREDSASQD